MKSNSAPSLKTVRSLERIRRSQRIVEEQSDALVIAVIPARLNGWLLAIWCLGLTIVSFLSVILAYQAALRPDLPPGPIATAVAAVVWGIAPWIVAIYYLRRQTNCRLIAVKTDEITIESTPIFPTVKKISLKETDGWITAHEAYRDKKRWFGLMVRPVSSHFKIAYEWSCYRYEGYELIMDEIENAGEANELKDKIERWLTL